MQRPPFLRAFVLPAALCALGFVAAMAAVLQYSLRAYMPGSLEPGGLTLDNFAALLKPLYARVFLDTVWICFLTAACSSGRRLSGRLRAGACAERVASSRPS